MAACSAMRRLRWLRSSRPRMLRLPVRAAFLVVAATGPASSEDRSACRRIFTTSAGTPVSATPLRQAAWTICSPPRWLEVCSFGTVAAFCHAETRARARITVRSTPRCEPWPPASRGNFLGDCMLELGYEAYSSFDWRAVERRCVCSRTGESACRVSATWLGGRLQRSWSTCA